MPHPSHRIDVLVVAQQPDQMVDVERLRSLLSDWGVDSRGKISDGNQVIEGGCARVWVDVPGRLMLYANQSGGFRVHCPQCGANVAAHFGRAHMAWKRGGERCMTCDSCKREACLEDWQMRPHGAFSQWALVFSGAGGTRLAPSAASDLEEVLGGYQVVVRRP